MPVRRGIAREGWATGSLHAAADDNARSPLASALAQRGRGHLYQQGTYKSFPVQDDEHFYAVCRYAERNALRANLVGRAEEWRWCSLAQHQGRQRLEETVRLCDWPLSRPRNWVRLVNKGQTEGELDALRRSVRRGCPFGDDGWQPRNAPDGPVAVGVSPQHEAVTERGASPFCSGSAVARPRRR